MATVTQIIDALPGDPTEITVQRREDLLLTFPAPTSLELWEEMEPLVAAHFPPDFAPDFFEPTECPPPHDIYVGKTLRLEWQQLGERQPFYHRNIDADELSYQVSGERTLITEVGTAELRPGDFSKIPVGIAHDNYGRKAVHLLFYVIPPISDVGSNATVAVRKEVPFENFTVNHKAMEIATECLQPQAPYHPYLSVSLADEALLLGGPIYTDAQLVVQRPAAAGSEAEWLYKSANVWLGIVQLESSRGEVYRCHRRADAIQYQTSGTRILVTQRGVLKLAPGDFVNVCRGCAYTSITSTASSHIILLTAERIPLYTRPSKRAERCSVEEIEAARRGIPGSL